MLLLLEHLPQCLVAERLTEFCSSHMGFGCSSLTLLRARYCMQGHHLAAASEPTTSPCFREYNNRSQCCVLPQHAGTGGVNVVKQ